MQRPTRRFGLAVEVQNNRKTEQKWGQLGLDPTTSWIEEQRVYHCAAAACLCKTRVSLDLNKTRDQAFFFVDHQGTG